MTKITRRPLVLQSDRYSREYGVVRSQGAHLTAIVDRILDRQAGGKRMFDDFNEEQLEGLRTPGFIWERVMSEHSNAVNPGSQLAYPGEMFWCYQCDETMAGTTVAAAHCNAYHHTGIFFTPDAVVVPDWFPVEWKFTWKSSKRTGDAHLDGLVQWQWQLGWQAMGLGADRGQVQGMFCRGDYAPGAPRLEAWVFDVEFAEKDLKKIKTMIVTMAKTEGML